MTARSYGVRKPKEKPCHTGFAEIKPKIRGAAEPSGLLYEAQPSLPRGAAEVHLALAPGLIRVEEGCAIVQCVEKSMATECP